MDGIRGAIGNVVSTVSDVADKIRFFLHFSVPDEGPLTDYEVQMADVEADSGGETEAGTTQKDVVRLGVVPIPAAFSVSPKWLKVLAGFKRREKLAVDYFDTEALEIKRAERFMEGYKAALVKDTSCKGLWKVSFTLREL